MLHYFAINYDIVLQDFKINQLELSLYFYYNIILPIEIIATDSTKTEKLAFIDVHDEEQWAGNPPPAYAANQVEVRLYAIQSRMAI